MPIAGGLLALILAILVVVLRRRGGSDDDDSLVAIESEDGDDVFAGVSLHKENLQRSRRMTNSTEASIEKAFAERELEEQEAESAEDLTGLLDPGGSRGYGERKNDDYIDEGSAGDALAEADIYIAYGRYLQAIELLEGAIENEPGNSAYRLKLIELYVDMGEEQRASDQLEELRSKGDTEAIARAEDLLGGAGTSRPSMMDTSVAPDAGDEGEIAFKGGAQLSAEAEESMQELDGALDSEADLDALDFSSDTAADSDELSPEPADLSDGLAADQVETIVKDFSEDLSEDLGEAASEDSGEGTGSTETPTF
jgi:pilus assembly protein FimV